MLSAQSELHRGMPPEAKPRARFADAAARSREADSPRTGSTPRFARRRHPAGAPGLRDHTQRLVDADASVLEAVHRAGHVQPPDPGPGEPGLSNGRVPVALEIRKPGAKGQRVMLPER